MEHSTQTVDEAWRHSMWPRFWRAEYRRGMKIVRSGGCGPLRYDTIRYDRRD